MFLNVLNVHFIFKNISNEQNYNNKGEFYLFYLPHSEVLTGWLSGSQYFGIYFTIKHRAAMKGLNSKWNGLVDYNFFSDPQHQTELWMSSFILFWKASVKMILTQIFIIFFQRCSCLKFVLSKICYRFFYRNWKYW